MAVLQFACPHCTGTFAVENPPEGEFVGCPHCGRAVAIPHGAGDPTDDSAAADSASTESGDVAPQTSAASAPFIPFDFRDEPAKSATRPEPAAPRPVRTLDRSEKRRRQQTRSILVMLFCLAVLAIAVVVLGRMQP